MKRKEVQKNDGNRRGKRKMFLIVILRIALTTI
jgi:hypothetical protein